MKKENYSDKKKWLLSYRELIQEVEDEAERAGFWRDKAEGLSAIILEATGVKSANHKTVYDCVDEFLEIAQHCADLAEMADLKKKEIEDAINKVDDPKCRQVLKMIYISGNNYLQVAEKMKYSIYWIKKLHYKGLDLLELPKEYPQISPDP